ncbi:STAG [Babesia duncani]|uniref:STAG n=1 Tax=Babesia duncani TaxID=323732 RepID=A0AAD9UQQ8_9APIC|nr:STAG [Babesia duncani]
MRRSGDSLEDDKVTKTPAGKTTRSNSTLFEIVILRKHAKINSCILKIHVTLGSNDKLVAIADILSFICECAGFKHGSIRSGDLAQFSKGPQNDDFYWEYFTDIFALDQNEITYEYIREEILETDPLPDCDMIFPDILQALENRRNSSWSSVFYLQCMNRVKKISNLLNANEGWAISLGKRNTAFIRFKEFFQRLISDCELQHIKHLFELLEWIFTLSLCGFRAVRQIATLVCDDLVATLLIKLKTLERQETVYLKQLNIELEMDRRLHEKKSPNLGSSNSNNSSYHTSTKVTNSTLELWKQLDNSRLARRAIFIFVHCVYNVNFTCKLRDVMVDNAVICAFHLGHKYILAPQIFSKEPYWRFVLNIVGKSQGNVKLSLLRYLAMLNIEYTPDMVSLLIDAYVACVENEESYSCEAIETILLQFVENTRPRTFPVSHPNEPSRRGKPSHGGSPIWRTKWGLIEDSLLMFLQHVGHRSPNPVLGILVTRLFSLRIAISSFQKSLYPSLDGLNNKYKSILSLPIRSNSEEMTLDIHDDASALSNVHVGINDIIVVLEDAGFDAQGARHFIATFINSLWENSRIFRQADVMIQMLDKGTDPNTSDPLPDVAQAILLQGVLTSMLKLQVFDSDDQDNIKVTRIVKVVCQHLPMLLDRFKANHTNEKIAIDLAEQIASMTKSHNVEVHEKLMGAVCEACTRSRDLEFEQQAVLIRTLHHLYTGGQSDLKHLQDLYMEMINDLYVNEDEIDIKRLAQLAHFCPLEFEVHEDFINYLQGKLTGKKQCINWCCLALVVYEAEVYKRVKSDRKNGQMPKELVQLPEGLVQLAKNLLVRLPSVSIDEKDVERFVCFCTICSILQISNLVGGIVPPESIHADLFRALEWFISRIDDSTKRTATIGGRSSREKNNVPRESAGSNENAGDLLNATKGAPTGLQAPGKVRTLIDYLVENHQEFDQTFPEAAACMVRQYTRTMSSDLYISSVSVLILLQLRFEGGPLYEAAAEFIIFLSNFDPDLLHGLLLYTLIGLYESCNRPLASSICSKFVAIYSCKPVDIIEQTIISAVEYSAQSQANYDFLTTIQFYVSKLKERNVQLTNGITSFLESQAAMFNSDFQVRISDLLTTIGPVSATKSHLDTVEYEAGNKTLNVFRTREQLVNFTLLHAGKNVKRKRPVSSCLSRRSGVNGALEDIKTNGHYPDAVIDISPAVNRNLTRSMYPPSVGIIGNRVPHRIKLPDMDLEDFDEIQEFEPVEDLVQLDNEVTSFYKDEIYTCPSVGMPGH